MPPLRGLEGDGEGEYYELKKIVCQARRAEIFVDRKTAA
jgi:hypothetical protein